MRYFLFLLSVAAFAQPNPTRVAMDGLLKIRFFPQRGEFMMAESVPVLFPPPGETKARLLIKKGGAAVVTKNMIIEPWPPHTVFGNLKAADGQMGFGPVGAGDYTMSVEMGGKEISAYKFSVAAVKGGDAFDPKTEMVRSGPWGKAAFLVGPVEDTGQSVEVAIWLSTREFGGTQRQVPYTMHLLQGAKQIGLVEGVVSDTSWEYFHPEVRTGHGGGPVKWGALMKAPGAYTLELRALGKTHRSYKFQVAGGTVTRIPQNELGYAGVDALPPQSLIADKRMLEFWLAPIQ